MPPSQGAKRALIACGISSASAPQSARYVDWQDRGPQGGPYVSASELGRGSEIDEGALLAGVDACEGRQTFAKYGREWPLLSADNSGTAKGSPRKVESAFATAVNYWLTL